VVTTIQGRAWKFGDNISADDGIIQYSQVPDLGSFDIPALKAMCFGTLRPEFVGEVRPGDLVVAGKNFGHHSHPHACVAMKQSGIAAVIVDSTDSAFIRKALNVGLPIVSCPGVTKIVADHQTVSVDLAAGTVRNLETEDSLQFRPFAPQMIEVWRAGGLAAALKLRLNAEHVN
jgi:3-isopropylmalate/(R)-2-methylmalate dehydratase small subunit